MCIRDRTSIGTSSRSTGLRPEYEYKYEYDFFFVLLPILCKRGSPPQPAANYSSSSSRSYSYSAKRYSYSIKVCTFNLDQRVNQYRHFEVGVPGCALSTSTSASTSTISFSCYCRYSANVDRHHNLLQITLPHLPAPAPTQLRSCRPVIRQISDLQKYAGSPLSKISRLRFLCGTSNKA